MSDTDKIVNEQVLEDAHFDSAFDDEPSVATPATSPMPTGDKQEKEDNFTQWAVAANGKFSPVGYSIPALKPGVYEAFAAPGTWGVERMNVASDEIYELPDMATNTVLDEVEKFWNNEERYRKHSLLYKRGVILHGPPGSGKTVCVKLLIKRLIDRGGIILVVHNVNLATMALKAIKRIEPNRNLICIFEDIDEIISVNGESLVLSMLDGEHNVDRVLNVATTNYPDRLGARIINRPSRFDRRVYVGMPNEASREFYLKRATSESLTAEQVTQWVKDTDGMSIAHLRELVAAVYCLDQPYDEVVKRLSEMARAVKADEEFKGGRMGFGGKKNAQQVGW